VTIGPATAKSNFVVATQL